MKYQVTAGDRRPPRLSAYMSASDNQTKSNIKSKSGGDLGGTKTQNQI